MKKSILGIIFCLFIFSLSSHALIVLNEAKLRKVVPVKLNETVVVRLSSNPTTGFDWYLDKLDQKSLKLLSDNYLPTKTGLVGSGGIKEFKFKAVKKGNKVINFLYYRVWEGKKKAVNKVTFNLCVK